MRLLEHEAKDLLARAGVAVPRGVVVAGHEELPNDLVGGRWAVKAQVPVGGRGKAGGVRLVADRDEAARAVSEIVGLEIHGHPVRSVLVEEALRIERELYVAVTVDASAGTPVVLAGPRGGMNIEADPAAITSVALDPLDPDLPRVSRRTAELLDVGHLDDEAARVITDLIECFLNTDALLVEINPLAIAQGSLIAVDAKIELDDAAFDRCGVAPTSRPDGSATEQRAAAHGLRLIELGGEVAILANGAGLTMATMDAVHLAGGRPANFLEIGGDAYTKATPALEIVLGLPGVRSLLVNFCGAFARCDVMAAGVVEAWEALQPEIPVFFSIHGTGQDEARELVRSRLGTEPYESMDDAVADAVAAAR